MIKREILNKLVGDNILHQDIAIKLNCSEIRVRQWFYRALKSNSIFCRVYNYHIVLVIIKHLN